MGDNNKVVQNLVLVGRTGNGKSATGNTILGKKAFVSKTSSSGVTKGCEMQKTELNDGRMINVIDTPGLFDSSVEIEFIGKEILRCIDLAKDGIHAVLVVFSTKTRFSEEEAAILQSLKTLFGSKIVNYMIVVFTGGDELEDNDQTLEEYLGHECPQPLKDILTHCANRMVLFDNKTKIESKKKAQVQELLSLVNRVVNQNGGKPYTDELFADMKKRQEVVGSLRGHTNQDISKLEEKMQRNYEDLLKRITDMVEVKLKETIAMLEKKLAEAEAARKRAEEYAQETQKKSNDEIHALRKKLEDAIREKENLRKPNTSGGQGGQSKPNTSGGQGGQSKPQPKSKGCSVL